MNYEEIKAEYTAPIMTHTENLLLEIPDNRTSSVERTPKQITWEMSLPSITEIWEITEKLPSLTQLVIEERENE